MLKPNETRVLSPTDLVDQVPYHLLGKILPGDELINFMMSKDVVVIVREGDTATVFIVRRVETPFRINGKGAIDIKVAAAIAETDIGVEFEDHPNPFAARQ